MGEMVIYLSLFSNFIQFLLFLIDAIGRRKNQVVFTGW